MINPAMKMSYDVTADMESFASGATEGMGMEIAMSCANHQRSINVHPRPPAPTAAANPRKKRRVNAKVSKAASQKLPKMALMQTLDPPMLSGYGDTIVLSNPFDDAPSKTCKTMPFNVGGSHTAQQMHANCMNGPPARRTGPAGPMTNGLGPRVPLNVGYRPAVHPVNNCAYRPINQSPNNLTGANNILRNLPSGTMAIKEQMRANENVQFPTISANDIAMNVPMNNVNVDTQSNQRQQLNAQCALLNNQNNQQTQYFNHQFSSNHFGNEVVNVEQLINVNMNITQPNQMGSLPGKKSPEFGQNKTDKMGHGNVRLGKHKAQQTNLQRTIHTAPKQHVKCGKTYPGDQPVILNYQNPHAPPIYPCGICHKEVSDNDQGIICESGCNFWFHRNCLGLSEAAFHLLTQEVYAEWACDNCVRTKNVPMVKYKS
ncbi:uncharacterized protein [Venturia canescens]|uniref:uncharacterized protein n=1 Tax=Venturia canescens TaxID=32260 RepID=UPI001C9D306B|nr:uncharacterized protein LOC122413168 [Venturia canescens]